MANYYDLFTWITEQYIDLLRTKYTTEEEKQYFSKAVDLIYNHYLELQKEHEELKEKSNGEIE